MPRSRRAAAAASDPDDLVRLHPRLRAAVDGHRRRRVSRQILGTVVIGGMLAATFLGDLLHPGELLRRRAHRRTRKESRALPYPTEPRAVEGPGSHA